MEKGIRFKVEKSHPNIPWCIFFTGMFEYGDSFEWVNTAEKLIGYCNSLLIRDARKKWFSREIKNILCLMESHGIKKENALCIGLSGGGYAALLIADLFGCRSLAFSPQTHLGREFNTVYDNKYHKSLPDRHEYMDIGFIRGERHTIYYPINNLNDRLHATRMNVILHPVNQGHHNVLEGIDRVHLIKEELRRITLGR